MLHLLKPTDPRWIDAVVDDLDAMLVDHAHCELKAAQSALALVGRFAADAPGIVEPLSALAREETAHFREVHTKLEARGVAMKKPETDGYVNGLLKAARQNNHDNTPILLDRLIVSALIEARSCERFQVLAEGLPDPALAEFYQALMVAEARHFALFSGLAQDIFGASARARLTVLAEREAAVVDALPMGPTVHG